MPAQRPQPVHSRDFHGNSIAECAERAAQGTPWAGLLAALCRGAPNKLTCLPVGRGVLISALTVSLCEAWLVIVLQWQVTGGSSSSLEHLCELQNQAQFLALPGAEELWQHCGEGDLEQYLPLMQPCSPKH